MRIAMAAVLVAALMAGGLSAPAGAAGWAVPSAAVPPPPPPPTEETPGADSAAVDNALPASPLSPARELLDAADAAVRAGNLGRAQGLFARIAWEHPETPEGAEARRALSIIQLRDRGPGGRPGARPPGDTLRRSDNPSGGDSVVVRREPYSLRTAERLRLTAWEKLDFGVTAFLYGMSLGLTFALGLDNPDPGEVTTPLVLGAAFYTLGAVAYLKVANPDRGDLPLMMAITSYVPTTTLLVSNFAFDNPNEKKVAFATATAGLASIPLAIAITQKANLDPGDTQLVRDAGFWGLVTFTTGTLGFARLDDGFGAPSRAPSGRTMSGMGLLGLGGGLGLGLLAASTTEVSLERVRVATWGGYGGAVLGALVGVSAADRDTEAGVYKGITVGALLGLVVSFIASSGLDGIPPADDDDPPRSARRWMPSLSPLVGANGRSVPALGLAGSL